MEKKKNNPQEINVSASEGDLAKHPDKKDLFEKGQMKREKESEDDEGIVVTSKNPESQEWHAREDVTEK